MKSKKQGTEDMQRKVLGKSRYAKLKDKPESYQEQSRNTGNTQDPGNRHRSAGRRRVGQQTNQNTDKHRRETEH